MKYTQEQLTAMAKSYLWHKEQGCPLDCQQFLMTVAMFCRMHPMNVETRIKMMSEGDFSFENKQ